MIDYPVKPRAISKPVKIRQALMADDDGSLPLKLTDLGKYGAGDLLADTIAAIQRTEQQCCKLAASLLIERECSEMYQALLGNYTPNTMTDAQKAELAALVARWDKEGDESDAAD